MAAAVAGRGPVRTVAPPQTYTLPSELARQVWRLTCDLNERLEAGASESGLMEAAWEAFLALEPAKNLEIVAHTFARRGATTEYARKSYSLPQDLPVRVQRRLNDLKELALSAKAGKLTLSLAAEAAQIHLISLRRPELLELLRRCGTRRKRVGE